MTELTVLNSVPSELSLPAAPSNPAQAYLMGLGSELSRTTMASNLNTIAKILGQKNLIDCPWASFRRAHVQAVMAHLRQHDKSPATINTYIAAMKGVALEAWSQDLIDTKEFQRIKQIKPERGSRLQKGRALTRDEMTRLMQVCKQDKSTRGVRDAAIFAILLGCGLRRSELVGLTFVDYQQQDGALSVIGKGNKQRRCFIPQASQIYLDIWIDQVRGECDGPLFTRIRRNDDILYTHLTAQSVYYILEQRGQQAAVKNFAPHDLRRTFASMLLDNGEDLSTVKDAMGHASIITTQKYDKRGEQRLQKASQRLSL